LNWTSGLLSPSEYSSWLIGFRTAQMWFLALAATIMYEIVPKRLHSSVLDRIVADVWNYTHSLGCVLPTDSPIHDTAPRILERVRHTAAKAHLDGCREIQIVAHSLGTVIAFNALTRYPASAVDKAPMSITHLYTIGSPLEKFLFIWHRTLRPSLRSPEIQLDGQILASGHRIQWQNFYSPLDMVSGKLMRFTEWGHVVNTRLWGLGGLARAHINYFRHPAVLTALAAGLGGNPQPVKLPLVNRISWYLIGVGENFLTPMMVLVALLLGLLVFLLFGALAGAIFGALLYGIFGWLINPLLGNFGVAITLADTVHWTALTCAVFMIMGVVVFTTKDGYRRAKTTHQKFWR
jgi:pimeloyl-ACP methyl ester carboxylesterase